MPDSPLVSPQSALVRLLGADDAALVEPHLAPVAWSAGDVVVAEGAPQPWLVLLLDGAVDVRSGDEVIATVEAPSVVGEVGFADGGPATATVVARGACAGMRIERSELSSLIQLNPLAAAALVHHANLALAARMVAVEEIAAADAPRTGRRAWFRRALARVVGAA